MRTHVHSVLAVAALGTEDDSILRFNGSEVSPLQRPPIIMDRGGVVSPSKVDLRPFGVLRSEACRDLKELAVRLGREEGVTTECSRENAASCMLLEYLDSRECVGSSRSRKQADRPDSQEN